MTEQPLTFESDGLRLEAMVRDGDGALAAVVLHPHPQYGGDMDNHVVTALCATIAAAGASTLRFNFRGAGRSEGTFSGGQGEAIDARSAVAALRGRAPSAKLMLAGYSFGAAIAAAVAADVAPAALVLVSPPGQMAAFANLPDGLPALFVTGDRDPIAPPAAIEAMVGPSGRLVVCAGVDHGWWPGLDELSAAVEAFLTEGASTR